MQQRELIARALFWELEKLRIMEERYIQEGGEKVLLAIVWTRRRIAGLQKQLKDLQESTFSG
jgi:hypothetical protein